MTSKAAALRVDLEGEASPQLAWMRSSDDFSTVLALSTKITYGGDSCVSDEMESVSECSVDGDTTYFSIGDTVLGIFLMVPLAVASSC